MRHTLAIALVLGLLGLPLHAQQVDEGRFDVILRGIPAGQLVFKAEQAGGRYAVAGKVQSTGIVAALLTFRYDATARGTVTPNGFRPSFYSQDTDRRGRKSRAEMSYSAGVPRPPQITPPRGRAPYDLDPATQGGTVDPLTAIFAVLRDQPRESACNTSLTLFDGRRRTQLTLGAPTVQSDGTATCTGDYTRLGGFSPEDLAERSVFPMTLRLQPMADKLRVTEVRVPTVYGDAVLRRR